MENLSQKETINNVKIIFSQKKNDETVNDLIYKNDLQFLFEFQDDSVKLNFNEKSHIAAIIFKVIDILALLFKKKKEERNYFYYTNILSIKEEPLKKLLVEMNNLQNYDFQIENPLLRKIYFIISDILDQKEEYSLTEFLDSILLKLSFYPGLDSFLKYQIYKMIIEYYLDKYHVILNFNEKEISITEDKSLELIKDLFQKTENNINCLIQSIIILNYGSLSDVIKNYEICDIFSGIEDMALRLISIKNVGNIILCVEKILEMFVDEMEEEKYNQKHENKKIKKNKLLSNNNEGLCKKNDKGKDNSKVRKSQEKKVEGNINIQITQDVKDTNVQNDSENNENCEINVNPEEPKLIIINLLNNIRDKIKMGNKNIEQDIDNLQKIMLNIAGENSEIKEKLAKQEVNMTELKERVDFLEGEYEDIKVILNKIQFRDLSKKFLRCFYQYLKQEDWDNIRKDKNSRGKIIFGRIQNLFPNGNKRKMEIVKDLLLKSSNSLNKGNKYAHSFSIDEYQNEMEKYKKEKNLDKINAPISFCFITNLGVSNKFDESFEESYSFLKTFFNRNFKSTKPKNFLELYFK